MANVCVITGGGSGMGLEAAKLVGKDKKLILAGRTVSKLEKAITELTELGIEAEAFGADASDREAVKKLAEYAASVGQVTTLIHAAGVSPHMADAEKIFSINACGTIIMNEVFAQIMPAGSVILNVSSMSAYMLPTERTPYQLYQAAFAGEEALSQGFKAVLAQVPEEQATGMAYTISKNFVVWYTEQMAVKLGEKGIRVNSISPGTFATPMGEVEGEEAAGFAKRGPMGRVGNPVEIARMMAFMVSDECSYLDGVDILYDGGAVAAFKKMMAERKAQ